ncbi:MAG: hypothetical protein WCI04_01250 [archaeon]
MNKSHKRKVKTALLKETNSKLLHLSPHTKKITIFLIKFFLIFGVASILIELINLIPLTNLITNLAAGFLNLPFSASTIFTGTQAFMITNSCTGLVSASILGAIIFALRKPAFQIKLTLFIWGSIALLLFNIPRIMLVLIAAESGFDAELVHEATWFVMSAIVLGIWYFGTKRITNVNDFSELV